MISTRLKGHALRNEGQPHFCAHGHWHGWDINWSPGGGQKQCCPDFLIEKGHALCECGALSLPGQPAFANKRWHRNHKRYITQRNQEI